MVRRTVSLPEALDELVREEAAEGESFSAALTRLAQEGIAARRRGKPPRYVGTGQGPRDLGRRAEQYLRDLVDAR